MILYIVKDGDLGDGELIIENTRTGVYESLTYGDVIGLAEMAVLIEEVSGGQIEFRRDVVEND